ncbi:MAG: PepSY domain-containing protein [Gallionellaceae bacterium]|nr:PepSY domain-containing protein [Gallionellaceae bacterium]
MTGSIASKAVWIALAACLGLALPAWSEDDHDRARRALEAGEVLSLRNILERVERDHPGQVMEIELEHEDGGWQYEIKLLRPGGALVKLKVDARDGRVLAIKGRDGGARRAP